MLSIEDQIIKIKEDFDKVISYSQDIEFPKTDKLFELWKINKQYFFEAFGNKLIVEIDDKITFELSNEAKYDRIESFINYCYDRGYGALSDFLDQTKDGFFKNSVPIDYTYRDIKITKGTKIIKAFKYFIHESEDLNDIQSKASQIIQENKIEGKLCFSIHPLDYLSVSENDHNWRSCHALDGEYRAGNLSYMMDNSTIVCYLKSEKDTKLPHFPSDVPWNSKKWRVLLYLSGDRKMIFAGKQYPFSTNSGMDLILNKYLNSSKNEARIMPEFWDEHKSSHWSKWTTYKIKDIEDGMIHYSFNAYYIPLGTGIVPLHKLVKDVDGSRQFNDVLKSSCYEPMYTILVDDGWQKDVCYPRTDHRRTRFEIGNMTYCLHCGENEVLDDGMSMMCYECERKYGHSSDGMFSFCTHCGERIHVEDGYYINDEIYCEDCFKSLGVRCDNCCDYFLEQDLIYNENTGEHLCKWCHSNRE